MSILRRGSCRSRRFRRPRSSSRRASSSSGRWPTECPFVWRRRRRSLLPWIPKRIWNARGKWSAKSCQPLGPAAISGARRAPSSAERRGGGAPRHCERARRTKLWSKSNAVMAKFIFVTGGVVSSLGKGVASASVGRLLESRGLPRQLPEVRPLHQRRPGHDEPLPARRGFRHRRRRRDRSRSRALRAVRGSRALAHVQRHHRTDLRIRRSPKSAAGTTSAARSRSIPHITNEIKSRLEPVAEERGHRHRRDRRNGRRHREPPVPRSGRASSAWTWAARERSSST